MISAVIFDLDGLLSDTEKLHRQAFQDTLAKRGVDLSDKEYEEHWIRAGKGIEEFAREKGFKIDPVSIREAKARRYETAVRTSAELMPGSMWLLNSLKGYRKLGLATSSWSSAAQVVISTLGIHDYFACIATRESVERVKPHPDIFTYVAEHLTTRPADCLVLEDAEKGVLAAKAAGMKCVAVPNTHTQSNDFSKATLVVPSLEDVTLELIESLE